jgi:hypothetical protein
MKQDGFKDLKIWQKAKELAVRVYKISDEGKLGKDFGLRDQIRRAALSPGTDIFLQVAPVESRQPKDPAPVTSNGGRPVRRTHNPGCC